jgi:hypothetical protein
MVVAKVTTFWVFWVAPLLSVVVLPWSVVVVGGGSFVIVAVTTFELGCEQRNNETNNE